MLERVTLLAGWCPERAGESLRLGGRLADRLEALRPDAERPAHGGFKPASLFFHEGRAIAVDFDAAGPADPALDVGCFLAYLRPAGLWKGCPQARSWFEGAAESFRAAYRRALLARGLAGDEADDIAVRSRSYEAAFLLKLACRRAHRLNSPRPGELAAILGEVAGLMAGAGR